MHHLYVLRLYVIIYVPFGHYFVKLIIDMRFLFFVHLYKNNKIVIGMNVLQIFKHLINFNVRCCGGVFDGPRQHTAECYHG